MGGVPSTGAAMSRAKRAIRGGAFVMRQFLLTRSAQAGDQYVVSRRMELGLRPHRKVLCITKLAAGSPTVEAPVDPGAGAIDAAIPGAGFAAQGLEVGGSAAAEALAREPADFHSRLVQPNALARRV